MINFDEELKKFNKSLEPSDLDQTLADADITDMNDVMFKLFKKAVDGRQ